MWKTDNNYGHPGCNDAIIPDVTGFLVPVKDTDYLSNYRII